MAIHLKSLLQKTTLLQPTSLDHADRSCPVCLETYLEGASSEFPRRLPCGHVIGTECLLIWAGNQANTMEGVRCPWCRRVVLDGLGVRGRLFEMIAEGADLDLVAARNGRRRNGGGVGGADEAGVGDEMRVADEARVVDDAGVADEVRIRDGVGGYRVGTLVGILSLGALDLALLVVDDYRSPYYHGPRPLLTLLFMAGSLLLVSLGFTGAVVVLSRWIDTIRPRWRFSGALLMLLVGFCVGNGGDPWWLGSTLLTLGKIPFVAALVKAYEENAVEMFLGIAAVLVAMSVGENLLRGERVFVAVLMLVVDCVTFWIVDCLI